MAAVEDLVHVNDLLQRFRESLDTPWDPTPTLLVPKLDDRTSQCSRLRTHLDQLDSYLQILKRVQATLNGIHTSLSFERATCFEALHSPIATTPPEILGIIFGLVAQSYRDARALTATCTLWREISLNFGEESGWRSLRLELSPQMFNPTIRRLADYPDIPLHLAIRQTPPIFDLEPAALTQELRNRLIELNVCLSPPEGGDIMHPGAIFPLLKRAHVSYPSDDRPVLSTFLDLASIQAPLLEQIDILCVDYNVGSHSNMRYITLVETWVEWEALESLPRLEILRIGRCHMESKSRSLRRSEYRLPALRNLWVEGHVYSEHTWCHFMNAVRAPLLETLVLPHSLPNIGTHMSMAFVSFVSSSTLLHK
jgi:hypothetical protein